MGAGAALQGRPGLHLPTAGVKGEDPVGAFPMVIPPTSDVDLPITQSHATALLGVQTEGQSALGSGLGLTLSLAGQTRQQNLDHIEQAMWMLDQKLDGKQKALA